MQGTLTEEATNMTDEKDLTNRQFDDTEEEGSHSGEFAELFQESLRQFQAGELVTGTVVKVDQDYILVDIGHKSEGRISIDEFTDENGAVTVNVGDKVRVLFEKEENEHGYIVLSKR